MRTGHAPFVSIVPGRARIRREKSLYQPERLR
jgi:hypothetical protein